MMNTLPVFPLPLVAAVGPGSHDDVDAPAYLPMPQGMATFRAPELPEPEVLAEHRGCVRVLAEALAALRSGPAPGVNRVIDLARLDSANRALLNQVLGEGEVAAQVSGGNGLQVQESVFAGVWRVLHRQDGHPLRDTVEVGSVPQALVDAALQDATPLHAAATAGGGADLMNAPSLLAELHERQRRWQPDLPAHVVNLSLLPLSAGDVALLDATLGAGRVVILSRGYGNCRITSTRAANVWRVTYFNSSDIVILDTLEVCRMPEVACAAAEDLADSAARLAEVLQWVQSPPAT